MCGSRTAAPPPQSMLRSPRSTCKQNYQKHQRNIYQRELTSLCDAAAHSLTASSSAPFSSNSSGLSSAEWRAPRPRNSRAHSLGGLGQSAFLCPGSPQLKHNPSLAALAGRCCSPSPAPGASRFPCTQNYEWIPETDPKPTTHLAIAFLSLAFSLGHLTLALPAGFCPTKLDRVARFLQKVHHRSCHCLVLGAPPPWPFPAPTPCPSGLQP